MKTQIEIGIVNRKAKKHGKTNLRISKPISQKGLTDFKLNFRLKFIIIAFEIANPAVAEKESKNPMLLTA